MPMHSVPHSLDLHPRPPQNACAPQIAQARSLCLIMAEGEAFSFFSVSLAEVFNAGPDYLQSTCNPGLIARTVSSQRAHDSSVLI